MCNSIVLPNFGGSFRRLCILLAVVGLERAFIGMAAFLYPDRFEWRKSREDTKE